MHGAHDLDTRWPALGVAEKRNRLQDTLSVSPGRLDQITNSYRAVARRAAAGLFRRDPSVWSSDRAVQDTIANRLGWLTAPSLMAESITRLKETAEAVKRTGFTDVVLLGMGGSSLAPEVLRAVLGVAPGSPRFQMLDSTDPAAIRAVNSAPEHTLYILASKSGTTIEPNSLAAHFRDRLERAGVAQWADHFIAITDEGTELADRARTERFRDLFINPSDIGGRYSAISFFGLVPAALMGQDVSGLVAWSLAMLDEAAVDTEDALLNPAVGLGLALGAAARAGRDKATLVLSPAFETFGLWVEQLVAESTGKQGVGIVPIAGEAVGDSEPHGDDRLFIHVRDGGGRAATLGALQKTGAPVVTVDTGESTALGAEFVRWEIATAVASAILDINPFDEPNVQQAKDATRVLLDRYKASGQLPALDPHDARPDRTTLTASRAARDRMMGRPPQAFLSLLHPGDYFAVLAYLGPDPALYRAIDDFRQTVRRRTRTATMFGYGPRYLHSTGQLHKGGPNTGVFLVITAAPREDLAIPGEAFSFGTLELAQALGDFNALDQAERRALHVHLPAPDERALARVFDHLLAGLPAKP
jgi:glucose-6-phosphate isomerase